MPNELVQLIVNSSGAVGTSAMFLWFLLQRDKSAQKKDEIYFNTLGEFQQKIQELSDAIRQQKEIIQEMYKELLKRTKFK